MDHHAIAHVDIGDHPSAPPPQSPLNPPFTSPQYHMQALSTISTLHTASTVARIVYRLRTARLL